MNEQIFGSTMHMLMEFVNIRGTWCQWRQQGIEFNHPESQLPLLCSRARIFRLHVNQKPHGGPSRAGTLDASAETSTMTTKSWKVNLNRLVSGFHFSNVTKSAQYTKQNLNYCIQKLVCQKHKFFFLTSFIQNDITSQKSLLPLDHIPLLCNFFFYWIKNLTTKVKYESDKCTFQDFLQNQKANALTGGSVFI